MEVMDQLVSARPALDYVLLLVLEEHVDRCLESVAYDNEEARAIQLLGVVSRLVELLSLRTEPRGAPGWELSLASAWPDPTQESSPARQAR